MSLSTTQSSDNASTSASACDSSSSSPGSWSVPERTHVSTPSFKAKTHRSLAPNLTRRAHKKSRAGCFSCKTRKIKCQETRPACENCLVKDLSCEYPAPTQAREKADSNENAIRAVVHTSSPAATLSSTTDTFTIDDLRCFHHFLTMAYPHLPRGNDTVWVHTIPLFAQEHEFLMHAMIALGASHLDKLVRSKQHTVKAMVHRSQAMKGLNTAIAQSTNTYGTSDAMLATLYALAFQSIYLKDGIADFMTLVKGSAMIIRQVSENNLGTAFDLSSDLEVLSIAPNSEMDDFTQIPPGIEDVIHLHPSTLESALTGLDKIKVLLTSVIHHEMHTTMVGVIKAMMHSSRAGVFQFMKLRFLLAKDNFDLYVNPDDKIAQLLLAFFLGIQLLLVPLVQSEFNRRAHDHIISGVLDWYDTMLQGIPASLETYLSWPSTIMKVVKALIATTTFEGPSIHFRIGTRMSLPLFND